MDMGRAAHHLCYSSRDDPLDSRSGLLILAKCWRTADTGQWWWWLSVSFCFHRLSFGTLWPSGHVTTSPWTSLYGGGTSRLTVGKWIWGKVLFLHLFILSFNENLLIHLHANSCVGIKDSEIHHQPCFWYVDWKKPRKTSIMIHCAKFYVKDEHKEISWDRGT